MRILVTNDDGIYSPGLWALAEAASQFGEVFVAAPDTEQSATGHVPPQDRAPRFDQLCSLSLMQPAAESVCIV